MTITIIILTAGVTVFILAIRAASKQRNKGQSKLSAYEHSSTFKKPDIEMVNPLSQKQYDLSTTTNIPSIQIKDEAATD
ncbi:MAG TPA: hypothetical protein VFZ33_21250 [Chitinophagaceae bacterium]